MSTLIEVPPVKHKREVLDQAVIRFAGDSGDGMQITGNQFTNTAALYGNDIATFPDYPAEIRAPAGTIPGVSGFQLHFSSNEVYTPGDAIDRKSTRLNSSHSQISYAVFCLKKKTEYRGKEHRETQLVLLTTRSGPPDIYRETLIEAAILELAYWNIKSLSRTGRHTIDELN